MRQAENKVRIEGILSEIDIKPGSFKKNGADMPTLGGQIKVKVTQNINGEDKELEIPVHMFAPKMTNKGTPNPAYESIARVQEEFNSIASAGGEEGADCVRITSGQLVMNEYYSQDGRFHSFPRVNASFISKIKANECTPAATFDAQFVVTAKADEVDSEGQTTGRYKITGVLPQYGGKVDVFPFFGESAGVIDAISQYWEIGNTVEAHGKLDFSSTTKTITQEVDFGEPIEKIMTSNRSELVITAGSQTPLDAELAYTSEEIKQGLAERKDKLDKDKERAASGTKTRTAPPADKSDNGFNDLGF